MLAIPDTGNRTWTTVFQVWKIKALIHKNLELDNRFRLGLSEESAEGEYVRDYGHRVAASARVDVFQVQDESGSVITSGHFRMDWGSKDRRFLALETSDSPLFAEMRGPEGPFMALVRVQPFALFGDQRIEVKVLKRVQVNLLGH